MVHYPLWSPDSTRVAFIAVTSQGLSLFLDDLTDSVEAAFILDQGPLWMSWSPDSKYLLVHRGADHFLVNTIEGLRMPEAMQRDLMRTYAAGYWQTLLKLRLPAAGPFVFNGLKICTTLALIGAIVAEFFGTPTVGMGFRISTEIGRMALDTVWAEIAVAALAGSAFYGLVTLVERTVTHWHPSIRR